MAKDPEKTEKPTGKRLSEARQKGNVPKSQDLSAVVGLIVGLAYLRLWGNNVGQQLTALTGEYLGHPLQGEMTPTSFQALGLDVGLRLAGILLPMVAVLMGVGIFVGWAQVGTLFTLKPLAPDITRLNPVSGFQRFFSLSPYVELLKGVLKIAIVGFVAYQVIADRYPAFVAVVGSDRVTSSHLLFDTFWTMIWRMAIALLILALADLAYQRWYYIESMKMSKQEIKDEMRQSEGSPQVKGEIRKRMRRMARRRMMQDVPKATVVITNPTHYAVAIRYAEGETEVPIVLAKGVDRVALQIREIADEHRVPRIENRPLAQALFKQVEIGDEIPPELYAAVAEILVAVTKASKKRAA